ncbi:FAD/NAD-binding domain-containing protein [Sparassis crispa]|uniref:FAD/NAD-binding domain-containing protein n=1 Tax=Sparassis crispa TaxID=139825 RepID=A0A401G9X2_9APHY|nr:FAD/NAD-binding domain-containing protein [Sparassis crispa]GBE78965.1 FAD/NAD-binding domain-containing protein [Sparassis crispa]
MATSDIHKVAPSTSSSVSWKGPFQLPTLNTLGSRIPPDIVPTDVAQHWFTKFKDAMQSQPRAVSRLFLHDAFWRDLLALSWDFRTIQNSSNIDHFLGNHLSRASWQSLALCDDDLRTPALRQPFPDLAFVQLFFQFETAVGTGIGTCRLVPTADGDWKAYTMFTSLTSLKGFPEKVGSLRDTAMYQGTWEEMRRAETDFADGHPSVVIIGGGHTGLEVAARLKSIGVSALVIEQNARVGDNWRHRYKSLCLHDPVWYDQMPYMPFPSTWPVYAPAAKLGNWLENYAESLELNVWTSSRVNSAEWDAERKSWTITVQRHGSARHLKVNHLIFASGLGGGTPNIPVVPSEERFGGEVVHSSKFTSAENYKGRKVVIIGACNSANDIARDCVQHEVDVTMFQRSSTFVISAKAVSAMLSGLYSENNPTDYADHLNASFPLAVSRQLHQRVFPYLAATVDKDILEGLKRVGFATNLGPDNAGMLVLLYSRGGGYYVETGAAQDIIDGKIKLKSGGSLESFTETGLRFSDGSQLAADVVIFATGFGDPRDTVKDVCGPEVRDSLKPVWGLDDEGELRSVWRESGHDGLWFAFGNLSLSRYYSTFLAMQIKAREEGLIPA